MEGNYIYGIVASHNGAGLTHLDIPGIDGQGLTFLCARRDIACLASHYSGPEFSSLPREQVLHCLLSHQAVMEHAMNEGPVLPAKFGTVLSASSELYQLLEQGRPLFQEALNRLQYVVEMEVVATWDLQQVLREIGSQSDIVAARETIAREPGAGLEARLRLGQMVKASLDRRRTQFCEVIVGCLRPLAVDLQPNALASDEMVMNVAFLIERVRQAELESCLRQLDSHFQDQLKFRGIGPLPPYSFATVEVSKPDGEKLTAARHLLGLVETCSEAEVRRAYRHLAAQSHPDRQTSSEPPQVELTQLRRAADLLIAQCRGRMGDDSFLIAIKRRRLDEVPFLRFAETEMAGAPHG
ncbi:MAG: GvpL/GvpF family gas vesicle protein [Chloroflexi bacterium]|nr:GvpL/GvpF family gas vesicle protein [Chloroflexota bacterium]